jgi:hypothetical protein
MEIDGPFKTAFDQGSVGVLRRELTTYKNRNGTLVRETVVRTYSSNGDYNDSTEIAILEGGSCV